MKNAQTLLDEIKRNGAATLVDGDGKHLFLVLSTNLGEDVDKGLLICYERGGVLFYRPGDRLNKFTLFQAGFSVIVTSTVLAVIEGLFKGAEVAQVKRLSDGSQEGNEG